MRFPSIDQIADPIARAAFGGRMSGDSITIDQKIHAKFQHDGIQYVSLIMPYGLGDIPWTIVVYAPEDDFIGTIKANRWMNSLIAIGVAAMTGLLGLALANRIYAPVRAFAVRSALVSQGEIDPNNPMPSTYKELEHANTTLVNEILQRKKTEAEYRLTFDMASRGMVYVDCASGRLLRSNACFNEMLGYEPGELNGVEFQSLLRPEGNDVVSEFAQGVSENVGFSFESEAKHKSGESLWISFNGVFINAVDEGKDYIVATIDNITQARESEEIIESLNREIARVSRQQIMGELATGLAHELNQPLTAITQNAGSAQFLIRNKPGETDEVEELLSEIDQQAHQAADIIRALRGFVRQEGNRASSFSIRELLDQSRRLVINEARQSSTEVVIRKDTDAIICGVRVQVAQVVVNLLRNAIEAMANANSPRRRVIVSTQKLDKYLQINVEDTGPGVADETKLFTAFETTKASGMGLGLSICRSLIEANGGKIWYERTAQGALFSFTLPLGGDVP